MIKIYWLKQRFIKINLELISMMMEYTRKTPCTAHSIISVGSDCKSDKSYDPQVLLDECKYVVRDKLIQRSITKDLFEQLDSFIIFLCFIVFCVNILVL